MPALYNLRLEGPDKYSIAKFDDDFNVEAVYELTRHGAGFRCSCPAGLRTVKLKPCKHQRMLPYMLGAVNTDRFYDPETRQWHQPMTADLHDITRESEAAEPPTITIFPECKVPFTYDPQPPSAAPEPATQAPPTAPSPNRPLSSADGLVRRRI